MSHAIAVEKSQNRKIGDVSATYASQTSCPTTCSFLGSGCYAEGGHTGRITRRLNSEESTRAQVARAEALLIDGLTGDRDLRVHVVGDCSTDTTAKLVSAAMARHRAKQGRRAWTYTHAWPSVDPKSWGDESVLASCETPEDVHTAQSLGWATALVVPEFRDTKAYDHDGVKLLPCPQQTKPDVTCVSCGLCMNASRLRDKGLTIGFAVHGNGAKKARAALAERNT